MLSNIIIVNGMVDCPFYEQVTMISLEFPNVQKAAGTETHGFEYHKVI